MPACPSFAKPTNQGTLQSTAITEASGLAASRKNSDVFWTHNDSGDTARIYAFNGQGKHLGVYHLSGTTETDFEDMAIGPDGPGGRTYLFFGDIGDNDENRTEIVVYRAEEPDVLAEQSPVEQTIASVVALKLKYPDGAHNAETLMVDPWNGDLYIVTKKKDGVSVVFKSPAPQDLTSARTLTLETTLNFQQGLLKFTFNNLVTAGDFSPDGQEILLRTYLDNLLWRRSKDQGLAATLSVPPCAQPVAVEPQGEAITFAPDGGGFYTLSEGTHPILHFFSRQK
jgi:hypothetical protein